MRKILNKALVFLVAGLMLSACEKNAIPEITVPLTDNGAQMKFFFHVENAPRANFYLDSEKVTAVAPHADGTVLGNAYGSVYPSNAYVLVPAGNFTMSAIDTVSATGGSADVLASAPVSLENGKKYSAYLVGTTDQYETFITEDKLPPADNTKIWWRFMNTMANIPFAVDVYAVRAAIPAVGDKPAEEVEVLSLGKNLAFKQHGEYVQLKPGSYTFKVFPAGTEYGDPADPKAKTFIQQTIALASLGRVYTTQIRGTYTETSKSTQIDYWRER